MKLIAIAVLGEGSKVCYDAAGNRYFVPTGFRKDIKVGHFAIINEKIFTSRTKTNEEGEIVMGADGKPEIEGCPAWTREDVTFHSADKTKAISTKAESKLLAAEEDAYVAKETEQLKVTYSTKNLQPA